jgi:hypothetical protein
MCPEKDMLLKDLQTWDCFQLNSCHEIKLFHILTEQLDSLRPPQTHCVLASGDMPSVTLNLLIKIK